MKFLLLLLEMSLERVKLCTVSELEHVLRATYPTPIQP